MFSFSNKEHARAKRNYRHNFFGFYSLPQCTNICSMFLLCKTHTKSHTLGFSIVFVLFALEHVQFSTGFSFTFLVFSFIYYYYFFFLFFFQKFFSTSFHTGAILFIFSIVVLQQVKKATTKMRDQNLFFTFAYICAIVCVSHPFFVVAFRN